MQSFQCSGLDFDALASREWIVTNGIGGFASSTFTGANTRRYHGLLVAALRPPTDRIATVSRIEEKVSTQTGATWLLGCNEYQGAIHPDGYRWVDTFERKPFPKYQYHFSEGALSKTIWMVYGSNTTIVEYVNNGTEILEIEFRPFLVHRDYHQLMQRQDGYPFAIRRHSRKELEMQAYEFAPSVYLSCSIGSYHEDKHWYLSHKYRVESERGLDDREDCFTPGYWKAVLKPGQVLHFVLTMDQEMLACDPEFERQKELRRLESLVHTPAAEKMRDVYVTKYKHLAARYPFFVDDIILASDQFMVKRSSAEGYTIIAGYPWFTDWGRDTMIAMRGIVLALDKQAEAKSILRTFIQYLDTGMIPNRFPDEGALPEYNTIDASLWLFVAVYAYHQRFGDSEFVKLILPSLRDIITWHQQGTRYHIHQTAEGLIYGGEEGVQLTWMDAKVDGYVVTPRVGCPVEINALWYNALVMYDALASAAGSTSLYGARSEKVKESFIREFFNGEYLDDVVLPGEWRDTSFRPNQLYAMSLPFSLCDRLTAKGILHRVRDKLHTSYGMRTLAKDEVGYKGVFTGSPWERDTAYHQGTVWPYLIGEYWKAVMRFGKSDPVMVEEVSSDFENLVEHFYENEGVHCISEVFDGDDPGVGKGCFHQAWSVSIMLEMLGEG